ncbi:MAG: cytochrome C oxidase subunit IV family protein [Ilumatobacteraceae bacterium]|nr:cytochrome C oxidase subunit IV family protein [Ilumatobacteraceae bacterium]
MSALTEHVEDHGHAQASGDVTANDGHHAPTDRYFIKVALVLALLTALETSTYWIHIGGFATPLLLILMAIKFFMIVLIFMHLKFDNKVLSVLFYMGLGLALLVYIVFLSTFQFFAR